MKKILNISYFALLSAFDNGTAGWKMEDGKIVMKDGNPVYVDNAGLEKVVEANTIKRLNDEAKTHREAKEAAEQKLAAFKDIDPEAAKKAIETVGKIDAKKLIDAGEVDKVKDQIKNEFTAQLTEKDNANKTLQERLDNMHISNVFNASEFVRDGIAVPRDMFEASFRKNFKVEDGKVTSYDKAGNRIMSKTRVGEYADPEEALQILVEAHPQKDVIMKANTGNGTGNKGDGGNRGTGRVIKRAEFDKLTPVQQSETMQKVSKGEMQLTD